jgi:hypothetical protein
MTTVLWYEHLKMHRGHIKRMEDMYGYQTASVSSCQYESIGNEAYFLSLCEVQSVIVYS